MILVFGWRICQIVVHYTPLKTNLKKNLKIKIKNPKQMKTPHQTFSENTANISMYETLSLYVEVVLLVGNCADCKSFIVQEKHI